MLPDWKQFGLTNGVGRVIHSYHKYLPKVGITITTNPDDNFDLSASHLGHYPQADIHFSHGLYWGNDITQQMRETNANIVNAIRQARAIVVPSRFVAETFRHDFRLNPYIIPHGIEWQEWQHNYKTQNYVLWNKNRMSNVCNPQPLVELAKRFPKTQFVTTFTTEQLQNIKSFESALLFNKMKPVIQKANIYLATTKETFGIGVLEALASNVPVLAFDFGGTSDIISHKEDGYLVKPYDYDDLAKGLEWLLQNRNKLHCIETAKQYSWLSVAQQIKEVCKDVLQWKLNN